MKIYTALLLATGAAMVFTVKSDLFAVPPPSKNAQPSGTIQFDAPPIDLSVQSTEVDTGTSTIPTFPRYINLPSQDMGAPSISLPAGTSSGSITAGSEAVEEYQLLGLGIRTVSFLGIQVYVVGLYVAKSDLATLQERLIRTVDPVATTLVPSERSKLQQLLRDPEQGSEIWNKIIKDGKIRTAIRIVPTRNTDFSHLRDGWVRGITGRTSISSSQDSSEFTDEAFGQSLDEFKTIFGGGRGKCPKGETLLFLRNQSGKLSAWYEETKTKTVKSKPTETDTTILPKTKQSRTLLGEVKDERISRLIWLLYLAGKNVSSESARENIINGAMELLERPVGTAATQVI